MNTSNRPTVRPITAQSRIASPLGAMLLARTERGLAGAWFAGQKHHPPEIDAPERNDDPLLAETARQLHGYFAAERLAFDVPLDLQGTGFQRTVWQALLTIVAGATRSYGQVARDLGVPSASRAVGAAVGRNPVSFVVPCHRALGKGGALTGYHWGVTRKQAMLGWEAGQVGMH